MIPRHLAAVLAAAAMVVPPAEARGGSTPPQGDGRRPNVLFLAIDDLNDWTGFLGGHPQSKTPNLDRLAARGMSFGRAYCAAPACNPSRAALLTGIRPSTSGVYTNAQPWRPAMPDAVTLPRHFMLAGYEVLGGGKIFHGRFEDPASWQEYFSRPADPMPPDRPVNGIPRTAHFDWGPVDVPDEAMGDHQVVDWAIDRLGRPHEEPLFLAVGLFRPHLPWYAPQSYFDAHPAPEVVLPEVPDDDLADVPRAGRGMARPEGDHRKVLEHDQWRNAVRGYLASIAFADRQVGRLLDALDRSGMADDTIIVLWGDHGWHLGEKQHWRKFALWEEATRVPFVIAAPGVTEPGSRCDRPVSLMDVYPTLIDLCGLPERRELEGVSLSPLLRDPTAPWDRPALTTHGRENHAVRSDRWRYIRYEDGSEELYDHDLDPNEWRNLADAPEHREVKAALAASLPKTDAPDAPSARARSDE
ncbi:sulfatase [Tautonia plasticadhaerens]|uniref:Choline-sulfatase n=1 Tax=Tautonia plasticadhaerens TaxID=2527974 RepID=A0A518HC51_9BACT|nr:sulfatase [Tautonia plasticadhaerens]QDV38417.1 Choline-sulfatase [Tautonia plasticadhaerens]